LGIRMLMRYLAYSSAVKLTWRHFATSLLHILKGSQIIESGAFTSTEVVYGVTGTELPEYGVLP
jgi:hypothetical protein